MIIPPLVKWVSAGGTSINIRDMKDEHLLRTMALIERRMVFTRGEALAQDHRYLEVMGVEKDRRGL